MVHCLAIRSCSALLVMYCVAILPTRGSAVKEAEPGVSKQQRVFLGDIRALLPLKSTLELLHRAESPLPIPPAPVLDRFHFLFLPSPHPSLAAPLVLGPGKAQVGCGRGAETRGRFPGRRLRQLGCLDVGLPPTPWL